MRSQAGGLAQSPSRPPSATALYRTDEDTCHDEDDNRPRAGEDDSSDCGPRRRRLENLETCLQCCGRGGERLLVGCEIGCPSLMALGSFTARIVGVEEDRVLPYAVDGVGAGDAYLREEKKIEDVMRKENVDEEDGVSYFEESGNMEVGGGVMQEDDSGRVPGGQDMGAFGDHDNDEPLDVEPLNTFPLVVYENILQDASEERNQWDTAETSPMATGEDAFLKVHRKQGKGAARKHGVRTKNSVSLMKACPHPGMSSGEEVWNLRKEFTLTRVLRQPRVSSQKWTSLAIVSNDKRKRLHWTPEEEEMLEKGVNKFSSSINKNIPWRKILEFGHQIFDPTRTPSDLKDKWRNMAKKIR
ncbi:hypothetical protein Tsubulata_040448 [Turnera subulata]|uniref:Myb-like domain-containing protein n=1 Tax=Turnera subulata TaxID=218843 RepID=A0A9Q0GJ25_9ROSI|nr:hypothetical protein Tsubulata_040448 [Turnera subulata]